MSRQSGQERPVLERGVIAVEGVAMECHHVVPQLLGIHGLCCLIRARPYRCVQGDPEPWRGNVQSYHLNAPVFASRKLLSEVRPDSLFVKSIPVILSPVQYLL
jgi:hypothetical protein